MSQETSMTHIEGDPGAIHELARYEVRPEALEECVAAIHAPKQILPP